LHYYRQVVRIGNSSNAKQRAAGQHEERIVVYREASQATTAYVWVTLQPINREALIGTRSCLLLVLLREMENPGVALGALTPHRSKASRY